METDIFKSLHRNHKINDMWIKKIKNIIDDKEKLKKYVLDCKGSRQIYKINRFIVKQFLENKEIISILNDKYSHITCLHYFVYKNYIVSEYIEGTLMKDIYKMSIMRNTKNIINGYINSLVKHYGLLAFDLHQYNIVIEQSSLLPKVIDIDCFDFYENLDWKETGKIEYYKEMCLEAFNVVLKYKKEI